MPVFSFRQHLCHDAVDVVVWWHLKKCLVEFVDGWRYKCTELHPKCRQSASDQYISAGRSSSLLTRTSYTSGIWSGRSSHISDVTLYFLAWVPCVLQVHLQLQQHVLKLSAADDGPVPVNSSSLWTNLRLLIKNDETCNCFVHWTKPSYTIL